MSNFPSDDTDVLSESSPRLLAIEAEPMISAMRIYLGVLRPQFSTMLPFHQGRGKGLYNFMSVDHREVDSEARTILSAYEVINVHPRYSLGTAVVGIFGLCFQQKLTTIVCQGLPYAQRAPKKIRNDKETS